jgi:membrane protein required for colicin V production
MEGLPFTLTDLAILAVVVVSGLLALSRGFVREVFALATWLGAGLATLYGFPYFKSYPHQIIPIPWAADAATALGLFLAAFIVISLVSRPITGRMRKSEFRGLDRSLGFFFGLLRGVVLVALAYLLMTWIWPAEEQPQWVREARALPYVAQGAALIRSLVPPEAAEAGAQAVGEAGKAARQGIESGQAIQDLTSPSADGGAEEEPSGYDNKERREMNRLFESNQ